MLAVGEDEGLKHSSQRVDVGHNHDDDEGTQNKQKRFDQVAIEWFSERIKDLG